MKRLVAWPHDVGLKRHLSTGPLYRAIICPLPFWNFRLDAIAQAIGIPEGRLLKTVNELTFLGLIQWRADGSGTVPTELASDERRSKMLRWV